MPTLLLLDDEKPLIKSLDSFFRRALPAEWTIAAFEETDTALAFLQRDALRDVRFCIVDLWMTGRGGAAFIAEAISLRPDLRGRVCVFSGAMPRDEDPLFTELGCMRLDKPFEIAQLRELVRSVLGGH